MLHIMLDQAAYEPSDGDEEGMICRCVDEFLQLKECRCVRSCSSACHQCQRDQRDQRNQRSFVCVYVRAEGNQSSFVCVYVQAEGNQSSYRRG
jgi:hypothetical protein